MNSTEKLIHQLTKLNQQLHRQLSLRYVFFSAVIKGVGYVIGATLVASIIIAIITRTITTAQGLPFVGSLIDNQLLESVDLETQ